MSVAEGKKIAETTIQTLQSVRSEENFLLFGQRSPTEVVCGLDVSNPVLSQQQKRPQMYEEGMSKVQKKSIFQRVWKTSID